MESQAKQDNNSCFLFHSMQGHSLRKVGLILVLQEVLDMHNIVVSWPDTRASDLSGNFNSIVYFQNYSIKILKSFTSKVPVVLKQYILNTGLNKPEQSKD